MTRSEGAKHSQPHTTCLADGLHQCMHVSTCKATAGWHPSELQPCDATNRCMHPCSCVMQAPARTLSAPHTAHSLLPGLLALHTHTRTRCSRGGTVRTTGSTTTARRSGSGTEAPARRAGLRRCGLRGRCAGPTASGAAGSPGTGLHRTASSSSNSSSWCSSCVSRRRRRTSRRRRTALAAWVSRSCCWRRRARSPPTRTAPAATAPPPPPVPVPVPMRGRLRSVQAASRPRCPRWRGGRRAAGAGLAALRPSSRYGFVRGRWLGRRGQGAVVIHVLGWRLCCERQLGWSSTPPPRTMPFHVPCEAPRPPAAAAPSCNSPSHALHPPAALVLL